MRLDCFIKIEINFLDWAWLSVVSHKGYTKKIRKIRDKYNYREEMKWSGLDRRVRFDVAREFFNAFMTEDARFNCIILNKQELDFGKYFQNNLYKVYINFSIALLKLVIGRDPQEIIILLSDDYFYPDGENLEEAMKGIINDHYKKFVIAGACQIDSKSSDMLQLTDLILGSILYDLKKQNGLVGDQNEQNQYKRKFLNFLYQKLKIRKSFFVNDYGFRRRNYVLAGDKVRATIFDSRRSVVSKFKK
ncbi:MAG: DUF3800 domain-containing protein [Candidatus Paceibacterota bacterium]